MLNLFNLQHKYASKCKRFETNVVRQLQLHWQKVFMSLQLLSVDRLNVTSVFDLRLWHQNQLTHSEQRNTVCTSLLTKEAVTQTLCKADFASFNMLWQTLCMHTFTLWKTHKLYKIFKVKTVHQHAHSSEVCVPVSQAEGTTLCRETRLNISWHKLSEFIWNEEDFLNHSFRARGSVHTAKHHSLNCFTWFYLFCRLFDTFYSNESCFIFAVC